MITLGNQTITKHTYHVATDRGVITVHASSEAHARKVAEQAGYVVHGVTEVSV